MAENNEYDDNISHRDTEPATKHDVTEGGVLGAVGGGIVGALAGGPVGAIVGAVAGGAASAGAVDVVDKHDNDYARTAQGSQTLAGTSSDATYDNHIGAANVQDASVIPVVEEELEVDKRQVQGGGARVHTTVTETPVEESVMLREEHVTVNRRPVDRLATDADLSGLGDRSFEVTETNEVPVVSKESRVVEEVVVGKTASERTETIHDTVRRTDVEIEQIDGQDMRDTTR